jgi:hypothetical protein
LSISRDDLGKLILACGEYHSGKMSVFQIKIRGKLSTKSKVKKSRENIFDSNGKDVPYQRKLKRANSSLGYSKTGMKGTFIPMVKPLKIHIGIFCL